MNNPGSNWLMAQDLHRPQDRQTLRAAAVELRSRGLTARDIAQALRLSETAVTELLPGDAGRPIHPNPKESHEHG